MISKVINLYADDKATERIVNILEEAVYSFI